MRDALVAINARFFTFRQRSRMHIHRTFALAREIHRVQVVAVAAFK